MPTGGRFGNEVHIELIWVERVIESSGQRSRPYRTLRGPVRVLKTRGGTTEEWETRAVWPNAYA